MRLSLGDWAIFRYFLSRYFSDSYDKKKPLKEDNLLEQSKMDPRSRSRAKPRLGLERNEIKDEERNRFVEIGIVIDSETESRVGNGARIRIGSESGTKIRRVENDCGHTI
ncbi:hypothetical protein EVAR_90902_1 [Eumeta japonica]|uniref:Uncharacterized protein n=1 Tax=Eumeta variegata TaxID=151549 RepID=A0A4C2A2E2_EUMVA|nr:hypothetical protein EVAR_90902_1 [Eumeta japonica]